MNRIVLCGDTHGILDTNKILQYQKSENKLDSEDYLIICGDCGLVWDSETLKQCVDYYQSFGTNILFIDGNHENFDLLNAYPVLKWNGGKVHQIADKIYHLMRGQVFEICGKVILTLGGANSTDIHSRQEHISWWREEEFDESDLKEAITNLKKHKYQVDFVISHSPTNEMIDYLRSVLTQCGEEIPYYLQSKLQYSSTSNNLQTIKKKIKYYEWICGHLHIDENWYKHRVIYNDLYDLDTHSINDHEFATELHDFLQDLIDGVDRDWEEVIKIMKKVDITKRETFFKYLKTAQTLSTSVVQRYLQIGFSSACKIIDYLEVIGLLTEPDQKTKQRTIIDAQDIIETLSEKEDY